jgi:hypothetical protein
MKLRIIIPVHKDEQDFSCCEYNEKLSKGKWSEITFHTIRGDFACRADAMNWGFNQFCKKSEYVMFLHCDTCLPEDYADKLYHFFTSGKTVPFCWFRLSFDTQEPIIAPKIIQHIVNKTRKEPYGDQAFTMSCKLFHKMGQFPSILLLEDVVFYRKIQQLYELDYDRHVIDANVITSDRRFRSSDGAMTEFTFIKNVLNNRAIIALHKLGVCPNVCGQWYYRNGLQGSLQ